MKTQKLLSFLLVIVLLLLAVPMGTFTVGAENATSGTTGSCTWTLEGTVLTISGDGNMGNNNQYTASNHRPWDDSITEVIIENGVTSIGDYAFNYCETLTNVIIPDSVTSIGDYAFNYCETLTSVIIPDSVTAIGISAFKNCRSLTSLTIPDSVTAIGNSAFENCTSLTSLTIPDSVTAIGISAFENCTSLTSLTIPDSVTYIGREAFARCKTLKAVNYNAINCSTATNMFKNCSSITTVNIGKGVKKLPRCIFYSCPLRKLYLPNSIESIGVDAFYDCVALEDVYFAGTREDWLDVAIEDGNGVLLWNNIIYESENSTPSDTSGTSDISTCTTHKMGGWKTTQKETCVRNGVVERTCSVCGYIESKVIEALGHNFKTSEVTKQPTCLQGGTEKGKCTRCDEYVTNILPATGHDFTKWKVDVESTCTQNGQQSRKCKNCDETETRTIKTSGHIFNDPVIVKKATISTTGLVEGECTVCGKKAQQIIPCIATFEKNGATVTADEGVFPEGTQLDIEEIDSDNTIYEMAKNALNEVSNKFVAYDILATLNGADLQPNGTFEVEFNIPNGYGKDVALYFVDQDGNCDLIDCEISEDGKTVSAEISELGVYAVCKNDDSYTETNGENNNYVWVIVIMVILLILVLGIVVSIIIIKKKNKIQ